MQRFKEIGSLISTGSIGYSYSNAMAESINNEAEYTIIAGKPYRNGTGHTHKGRED